MQVKVIKKIDGRIDRKTGNVYNERLRVCAYCRVSTDSEEQKNSYDSQLKYYKEKITTNSNWSFAGIYADEAISGTLDYKRDDFMRMITDALEGKFDLIMTKSISRFARNTVDTLKYVRKLKEKNIAIIFEEENINTLEMAGELLLTILSSIAQQESENISTHVKLGLKMKMERGELVGFNNCLGYRYDYKTNTMSINEEEAEIVKYVFRRYCEGAGSTVIARELAELGHKSPKGEDAWAESTVRGIIKNEKYIGNVLMGKTYTIDPISHKRVTNMGEEDKYYIEEHHEPIIPLEVYEKAQYILNSRRVSRETGRKGSNYSRMYPFSSMLYCGFCGEHYVRKNLYPHTNYSHRAWQCMKYVKKGKKFCPDSKILKEEIIENCFVEAYRILTNDNKEIIKNFIDKIDDILEQNNAKSIIEKLELEKQNLEDKQNKLLNLVLDGTIDKEMYASRKDELNKKIKKIDKQQEELSREVEDDAIMNSGRNKIKAFFEKEDLRLEEFDEEIFETLVHKAIIGEVKDNGEKNPYVINFVFKSGFEYDKIKTKTDSLISSEEVLILQFDSFQNFVSFEKQPDGSLQKKLKTKIKVKVTLNN